MMRDCCRCGEQVWVASGLPWAEVVCSAHSIATARKQSALDGKDSEDMTLGELVAAWGGRPPSPKVKVESSSSDDDEEWRPGRRASGRATGGGRGSGRMGGRGVPKKCRTCGELKKGGCGCMRADR